MLLKIILNVKLKIVSLYDYVVIVLRIVLGLQSEFKVSSLIEIGLPYCGVEKSISSSSTFILILKLLG